MEEEEGIGLANAERIVDLNLNQITKKLLQTCTLSCSKSDTYSDTLADEVPANTHHNCSYKDSSPLNIHYRAEVLRSCEDNPCHAARITDLDIGGDMNHIHRVTLQLLHENSVIGDSKGTVVTVIVKTAPDEVLYLKKECGERVKVDQHKVEFEYNTLIKFNEIQAHSVPHVYILDRQHKSIVMEDLSQGGFNKLQDVLISGDVDVHITAIEGALAFIGHVHRTTWLEELENGERRELIDIHSNSAMRQLMAELLFDRPFSSEERSNTHNPQLTSEVEQMRGDPKILAQLTKLKRAFLQQDDCLCHGDLATDNVMVAEQQFRVIDLEFSGVGLRAYDLALFLEMTIFRLLCSFHSGQLDQCRSLYCAIQKAAEAYELGVGQEKARDPLFVEQTCGLIALELMWMVFGSYDIVEFGGDPSLEKTMLSMATNLLLRTDTRQTIGRNIRHQFTLHNLQCVLSNS